MTWREFKDELEEQNVTDDEQIEYLDVFYPAKGEIMVVHGTDKVGVRQFCILDA